MFEPPFHIHWHFVKVPVPVVASKAQGPEVMSNSQISLRSEKFPDPSKPWPPNIMRLPVALSVQVIPPQRAPGIVHERRAAGNAQELPVPSVP